MPEPLKNLYTPELIKALSEQVKIQYCDFDDSSFTAHVFDDDWESKELKERMKHISESLHHYLPANYLEAIQILIPVSSNFSGFEYMFFPGFVELYGLDEYETSIDALEFFTQYSSSEFAVRPFIIKYGNKMVAQIALWAESENHHVRRLASEGCRPRLPWAMALPDFKQDPSPILPILAKLKNDNSEYVRRSVANNLNDISKDNPHLVIELARTSLGYSLKTDWLIKHACRTLLKQGHTDVMVLFGFPKPEHIEIVEFKLQNIVEMGESLEFSFRLISRQQALGKLRLEYAIDFYKKNGSLSRKVFKISESDVKGNSKTVVKFHSFKAISTRKYYSGNHALSVIANGQELASLGFQVT